MKILPTEIVVK